MGFAAYLLPLFCALAVAAPARAEDPVPRPPRQVLLTAFEPFAGRSNNGSKIVADLLKSSSYLAEHNVQLHVCIIPVEYVKGAQKALECLVRSGRQPLFMISTGEAACDVRLETRFHNLDNTPTLADNGGHKLVNQPISRGGAAELPSTLPLADMYCSLRQPGISVRPSTDPGNFVCNSTAYRLQRRFLNSSLPFGFIHLPQGACPAGSHAAAAKAMEQMIVGAADALDSFRSTAGPRARPPRLPVSSRAVGQEAKKFEGRNTAQSCGALFYGDLTQEYGMSGTPAPAGSVVPIEKQRRGP